MKWGVKKQETFLRKTFPKILEEEVNKRLGQVQKSESPNVDPFSSWGSFRKGQRNNKTKRTSIYKKSNIKWGVESNANQPQTDTMDKTLTFGTHNVQSAQGQPPVGVSGVESFRQEMAAKMDLDNTK